MLQTLRLTVSLVKSSIVSTGLFICSIIFPLSLKPEFYRCHDANPKRCCRLSQITSSRAIPSRFVLKLSARVLCRYHRRSLPLTFPANILYVFCIQACYMLDPSKPFSISSKNAWNEAYKLLVLFCSLFIFVAFLLWEKSLIFLLVWLLKNLGRLSCHVQRISRLA
jgi:hypothetical protein